MHHKKTPPTQPLETPGIKRLEVVLKSDTAGTEEAISAGIAAIEAPGVEVAIIQSGVGNVS